MSRASFRYGAVHTCHTPDHPTSPHHHGTGGAAIRHRHPGCPWDCGMAVYARSQPVPTADRMRRAAALLRERVEAATDGPWEVIGGGEYVRGPDILVTPDDGGVSDADAEFIAMMHPPVAVALAKVLGLGADLQEMHGDVYGTDGLDELADAILREGQA